VECCLTVPPSTAIGTSCLVLGKKRNLKGLQFARSLDSLASYSRTFRNKLRRHIGSSFRPRPKVHGTGEATRRSQDPTSGADPGPNDRGPQTAQDFRQMAIQRSINFEVSASTLVFMGRRLAGTGISPGNAPQFFWGFFFLFARVVTRGTGALVCCPLRSADCIKLLFAWARQVLPPIRRIGYRRCAQGVFRDRA